MLGIVDDTEKKFQKDQVMTASKFNIIFRIIIRLG